VKRSRPRLVKHTNARSRVPSWLSEIGQDVESADHPTEPSCAGDVQGIVASGGRYGRTSATRLVRHGDGGSRTGCGPGRVPRTRRAHRRRRDDERSLPAKPRSARQLARGGRHPQPRGPTCGEDSPAPPVRAAELTSEAYDDRPLPIGAGQDHFAAVRRRLHDRGAACLARRSCPRSRHRQRHQAAILAEIGAEVFSIEIVAELSERARVSLDRSGYERVKLRSAMGMQDGRAKPRSRA